MSERYFIRVRGDVQGPFDENRLRKLAQRGRFSRSHEVSTDGLTWSRAAEFLDLFPPPPTPKFRRTGRLDDDRVVGEPIFDEPDVLEALWFYTHDESQYGPYDFSELRLLASEGVLQPDDFVWREGLPDWVEAARVPGLLVKSSAGLYRWIMLVVAVTAVVWLLRSLG